ncbi:hypothetical protein AK812_SmicGene13035 [Symbiodinium microadriaticum]|uniref:Uncharacterized protein n=1 Tax=Symbiodinium microadriaticum TaxID=2951 RepID=A0A1Q9E940_SYMMI|nr:hypothetical protein AK812_SmicGene13035 [Symbiodinium microadriaticum]
MGSRFIRKLTLEERVEVRAAPRQFRRLQAAKEAAEAAERSKIDFEIWMPDFKVRVEDMSRESTRPCPRATATGAARPREGAKAYFDPLTDANGLRYWRSDRSEQLLYFRSPEQIWVLSSAANQTSRGEKQLRFSIRSLGFHLHLPKTAETFVGELYQYFGQHKDSPCFKRWKLPQLFLLKSIAGLWVIRGPSCKDLCTSSNLIDKRIERASCTVAEEWPEPPEPASSSTPAQPEADKKRRVTIGYNMERVRQYVKDEHARGLLSREGEDCDMKVKYAVFGRACYKPSDNGISGADSYEPTGTYDMLQKNLGQDARTALHQKEALHETSSWRCGGCDFAADSAHGDPHSDSEAIRAGGETYCLKQIGSYQTVVMAT